MGGLMVYLAGPGRRNEHTAPHLIGGDPAVMAWHDDNELSRNSALSIAKHLDQPRTAFDVDIPAGHVWHCSLSLRADEGMLTDEQWSDIASNFVTAMEFDDNQGTKAPCRWAAVHHGVSENGNDHVHLVVNLVREDGTKASVHNDYHRSQTAARALEAKHGLERLESMDAERSTRGYDPAEREAAARSKARGKYERTRSVEAPTWNLLDGADRQQRVAAELRADQPRYALARTVRGCATASQDEAEFVRRMRRAGVLVRPRYADGRTDVITGYSAAARPEHGQRPIWYGGGHLGRDLTLPRLRAEWPDTPTGASAAAAEWNASKRNRRVVNPGRETREPDPQLWQQYSRDMTQLRERLQAVPPEDRETWARIARDTAGAFAAWSLRVEDTPGDLAATADALAVSAQTHRRPVKPRQPQMGSVTGTAMLLASAARGGRGTTAEAIMLRQLVNLAGSIHDAAQASGEARYAAQLATIERERMRSIAARLPRVNAPGHTAGTETQSAAPATTTLEPEAAEMLRRVQASQQRPAGEAASPVPKKLHTDKPAHTARTGPDRGTERQQERD